MDAASLNDLNDRFENAPPNEIVRWAWESLGPEVAATSSFQSQSVPLLHMIARVAPEMPVCFLDTGFHFPETLAFRDQLVERLGLKLQVLKTEMGHDGFRRRYGDLYRENPDLCCYINKVAPLRVAMKGLRAWVSGIRRDQTLDRGDTPILARQPDGSDSGGELIKVSPIAGWTRRDVWQYIHDHDLPTHPLMEKGFLSVGCAPCTRPVTDGESERAGRWPGTDKEECGIHIPVDQERGDA